MSEEEKTVETTDTDTSPETDGNTGGVQLTQDALDQMMGERARRAERAKEKAILEELGLESMADAKKALKALREKQQAEMSELEKAQAALDKLKAEKAELQAAMRENQIQRAVEIQAAEMSFHNPARAYDLMDRSEVDLVDGEVTGVDAALKALVKAEPYLVKSKEAPNIDATKTGKRTQSDDDEAKLKRNLLRWGIQG